MASVPANYIRWKEQDYDGEIFAALAIPVVIAGHTFRPPSVGVFALLEILDSKIVSDFEGAAIIDFYRAAYVMIFRENCAASVMQWKREGGAELFSGPAKNWHQWDKDVCDYFANTDFRPSDFIEFRKLLMGATFAGYEMIPDNGPSSHRPYLFGADTIAQICRNLSGMGITMREMIWEAPLCLCGFISASAAKENGTKGVGRPKDPESIKSQIAEANEREERGELHPWQVEEPNIYRPTEKQIKANPEIVKQHNLELKKYLKKMRESKKI
jgi:hypothetical protein